MFRDNFSPPRSLRPGWSIGDRNAMKILEKTCKFQGEKPETGLLWKNGSKKAALCMPTSASEIMAKQRTLKMKARLSREPEQMRRVMAQMQTLNRNFDDTQAMRFLRDWDDKTPLRMYRMMVNCFRAASSSTNCIHAFQQNAVDNRVDIIC